MYGSLSGANTYFETYDLSGTWDGYSDPQKTAALNRATLAIDRLLFRGQKYQQTQTNEFPRVYYKGNKVIYFDVDEDGNIEVPEKVIHATYEQAKYILDTLGVEIVEAMRMGITSQSIGATSESYSIGLLPEDLETGIAREVNRLLKHYTVIGW